MKAHFVIAMLCLALAVPQMAMRTEAAPQLPAYHVKGFRSAQFGQSEKDVTAAIEKDFRVKAGDVHHLKVPTDGTTALVVNQAQTAPAPGPVR